LIVDQPTDLPEGLVVNDDGDELDERERTALDAAISRSVREADAGQTAPAEEILKKLRARRQP
jgi:hypothetical protein